MNSDQFLVKASNVRSRICELLQLDHSERSATPLHSLLNSLVHRWFTGDRDFSELDVVRLEYLAKHLSEIEEYDPSLLRRFRREFRRAKTQDNLEGLRFECYVAASLARKNVIFSKSEAPDFKVDNQNAGLECTSIRLQRPDQLKDLSYKIESAIGKKEKTKSNRPHVILLIDITNILHGSDLSSITSLRPAAKERVSRTQFASVVMFCHVFSDMGRKIATGYFREDNSSISPAMFRFIDGLFPIGKVQVGNFYIPSSG